MISAQSVAAGQPEMVGYDARLLKSLPVILTRASAQSFARNNVHAAGVLSLSWLRGADQGAWLYELLSALPRIEDARNHRIMDKVDLFT